MSLRPTASGSISAPEMVAVEEFPVIQPDAEEAYYHNNAAMNSQATPGSLPQAETQFSEHGHDLRYVRPMTQHPGAAVATFVSMLPPLRDPGYHVD
jgi:hypothetical protein